MHASPTPHQLIDQSPRKFTFDPATIKWLPRHRGLECSNGQGLISKGSGRVPLPSFADSKPDHRNRPGPARAPLRKAPNDASSRAISLPLPLARPVNGLVVQHGRSMRLSIWALVGPVRSNDLPCWPHWSDPAAAAGLNGSCVVGARHASSRLPLALPLRRMAAWRAFADAPAHAPP